MSFAMFLIQLKVYCIFLKILLPKQYLVNAMFQQIN